MIFNGKHAVAALQSLAPRVAAMSDEEKETCEWLGGALTAIFKDGLAMAVFEFDTPYERLTHITVQALAHEEDCGRCVRGIGWWLGRRAGSGGPAGRVALRSFLPSPRNNRWCLRIAQGEALSIVLVERFCLSRGGGRGVDRTRAGGGFT